MANALIDESLGKRSIRDRIAAGFGGFAAGLGGNSAAYLKHLDDKRKQESDERMVAAASDIARVNRLLKDNKTDDAMRFWDNRLQNLNRLGAKDQTHSLGLYEMLARGDFAGAIQETDEAISAAQNRGFYPKPKVEFEKGYLITTNPNGTVDVEKAPGIDPTTFSSVQKAEILPDGTIVSILDNGQRRVTNPSGEVVTGEAAARAITEANKVGVDLQFARAYGRSGGGARGKGEEERGQLDIDNGRLAADSTAIIRRSLQLLDFVETGTWEEVGLRAKRFFGVEGADEGELSANLGKAVLSQLRTIFGAAFTAQEGAQLVQIEAGFGKSTAANRRLLNQSLQIAERAARRGQRAASAREDYEAAAEIQKSLEFVLTDEALTAAFNPSYSLGNESNGGQQQNNNQGLTSEEIELRGASEEELLKIIHGD